MIIILKTSRLADKHGLKRIDRQTFKEYFEKNPSLKGILLGVHGARETMFEIGYFKCGGWTLHKPIFSSFHYFHTPDSRQCATYDIF